MDKPLRVLLVDDDEDEFVLLKGLLTSLPRQAYQIRFRLEWVPAYEDALAAIEQKLFDVYLIDYRLGGRSGLELLREANALDNRAPIIILTGQGSYDVDVAAMQQGAADYLVKDQIDGPLLERAIRYAVERRKAQEELQNAHQQMETVLKNAPGAILVADRVGNVVLANPAAEWLLGQAGRSQLPFFAVDGKPYTDQDFPLTRAALYGESYTDVEMMVRLPDGQQRYIQANATPILDHRGRANGAVGIFQDITHRKQTEEELRRNAARAEVVAALSQALAQAGLNSTAVLNTIARQIAESLNVGCIIRLISDDGNRLHLVAFYAHNLQLPSNARDLVSALPQGSDEGLPGIVYRTGEPMLLDRLSGEEARKAVPEHYWRWVDEFQITSMVIVPLRVPDRVFGTVAVFHMRTEDSFTEQDIAFYQDLADRAALALENARLYQSEAQRALELDALHQATSALLKTLDLQELLTQILDAAQSAIPAAEKGMLHLIAPDTGFLHMSASSGFQHRRLNPEVLDDAPPGQAGQGRSGMNDPRVETFSTANRRSFAASVVRERQPLIIHDTRETPIFPGSRSGEMQNTRSLIAAPLMVGSECIGALSLSASQPAAFRQAELRLLVSFAATTSAAIQNARLHAEVQTLSITDPLTEVLNRRGLYALSEREIERALRFQRPLSAIVLDIDLFKEINDTYGHAVGDEVLKELAQRFTESVRIVDILARIGGEEFAILLPESNLFDAHDLAERLRVLVAGKPFTTRAGAIQITISLGVAQARAGIQDLDALLDRADRALYMAKKKGRNRVETG